MLSAELARPVILYADDHRDAHELMRRAFRTAQVKVIIMPAGDGTEVLQYLSKSKETGGTIYPWPTLLLLDLKMPKLSGFQLLHILKDSPELQGFPIVVFTLSNDPTDPAQVKALGCSALIKSQFEHGTLVRLAKAIDVEFFGGQPGNGHQDFKSFCVELPG